MSGKGPGALKVGDLLSRLTADAADPDQIREIILATNSNLEGEATAMYLHRLLAPLEIRVTRLARGLSTGSELEYADEVTISRAFEGRQDFV